MNCFWGGGVHVGGQKEEYRPIFMSGSRRTGGYSFFFFLRERLQQRKRRRKQC
jgi:hypothetical protein